MRTEEAILTHWAPSWCPPFCGVSETNGGWRGAAMNGFPALKILSAPPSHTSLPLETRFRHSPVNIIKLKQIPSTSPPPRAQAVVYLSIPPSPEVIIEIITQSPESSAEGTINLHALTDLMPGSQPPARPHQSHTLTGNEMSWMRMWTFL